MEHTETQFRADKKTKECDASSSVSEIMSSSSKDPVLLVSRSSPSYKNQDTKRSKHLVTKHATSLLRMTIRKSVRQEMKRTISDSVSGIMETILDISSKENTTELDPTNPDLDPQEVIEVLDSSNPDQQMLEDITLDEVIVEPEG